MMTANVLPEGADFDKKHQGHFNLLKPYFKHPNLQEAYAHFNRELFEDNLPPCLVMNTHHEGITLRQKIRIENIVVENILINEVFLKETSMEDVLYALCREMEKLNESSGVFPRATVQPIAYRTFVRACDRLITASYAVRWYKAYASFISCDFL